MHKRFAAELEDVVPVRIGDAIDPAPEAAGFVCACRAALQSVPVHSAKSADGDRGEAASRASADKAEAGVIRRARPPPAVVGRRIRAAAVVPAKSESFTHVELGIQVHHALATLVRTSMGVDQYG